MLDGTADLWHDGNTHIQAVGSKLPLVVAFLLPDGSLISHDVSFAAIFQFFLKGVSCGSGPQALTAIDPGPAASLAATYEFDGTGVAEGDYVASFTAAFTDAAGRQHVQTVLTDLSLRTAARAA